jgi:hypothetical protein
VEKILAEDSAASLPWLAGWFDWRGKNIGLRVPSHLVPKPRGVAQLRLDSIRRRTYTFEVSSTRLPGLPRGTSVWIDYIDLPVAVTDDPAVGLTPTGWIVGSAERIESLAALQLGAVGRVGWAPTKGQRPAWPPS